MTRTVLLFAELAALGGVLSPSAFGQCEGEPPGTPCGDPSDTDCDNPDTCDGFGTCEDNLEPDGTSCDDGNPCTDPDTCTNGVCEAGPPVPECCTTNSDCDDGLVCTDDWCDPWDYTCVNDLMPGYCLIDGVCYWHGDPNPNNECEVADSSNPYVWSPRPAGTACTDDGNECTADECDGAGSCGHPYEPAGTACGDPTDTDCGNPDTCDGAGSCGDNLEPDGTPCQDGDPCTDPDTCTNGVCVPGGPVPNCCYTPDDPGCDDGIVCTSDWCDMSTYTCDNDLDPGYCLINNVCYQDGETNPGNECEVCDDTNPYAWSPKPSGTSCTEDGNECTADECDGSGTCTHPDEPAGTACGDQSSSDCDNPNTCDGSGTCQNNYEPSTSLCRPAPGDCDLAEFCTGDSPDCPTDGSAPVGTPCPDGLYCNGQEVCDGFGVCQDGSYPCETGQWCNEDGDVCLNLCEAQAVVSCRDHGTAGRLCLDLGTNGGIEPRMGGILDLEIDLDDASGFPGGVTVNCDPSWPEPPGTVSVTGPVDDTVTLEFDPALPDEAYCIVTLACGAEVCVRSCEGDMNRDGSTDPADASQVKLRFDQTPTESNCEWDFNADGAINPTDFLQVKLRFGFTAPACP